MRWIYVGCAQSDDGAITSAHSRETTTYETLARTGCRLYPVSCLESKLCAAAPAELFLAPDDAVRAIPRPVSFILVFPVFRRRPYGLLSRRRDQVGWPSACVETDRHGRTARCQCFTA